MSPAGVVDENVQFAGRFVLIDYVPRPIHKLPNAPGLGDVQSVELSLAGAEFASLVGYLLESVDSASAE
jgi:hypothetical protein